MMSPTGSSAGKGAGAQAPKAPFSWRRPTASRITGANSLHVWHGPENGLDKKGGEETVWGGQGLGRMVHQHHNEHLRADLRGVCGEAGAHLPRSDGEIPSLQPARPPDPLHGPARPPGPLHGPARPPGPLHGAGLLQGAGSDGGGDALPALGGQQDGGEAGRLPLAPSLQREHLTGRSFASSIWPSRS
ncbi:uncharacterized protein LOC121698625 isoform X1 [Alosa sapidissima]|uniref:uncharacterized protein LOC121698624 isoform X1 n=1 Tax=Alosa sapidissima TaxID=34773 RepID=UPI001C09396C|nr:uncharacterized protein LOC121698624 isoform X1 [Alosa sapidissima]XP_041936827.1 uncharacterized protein LOC121698624 isoform X1 [Alosa sapidissima]XP_041936828.1 uncharacterized protein LOC121698624 isoform X1 [Alosa sapidissima]XP_041936829.1 uncharacterized protein LOC121698624 isoform X1 [Alosa sapidissima]XP_041936833.1 uncharacterized protein LOC121698625 isoform X1 [Alosa sapidissima]XP_041936834.1 uncharacterized protein LOC121698625 isoform X1 [Alosa sapidissima]XP_041936835.1 un